MLSDRSERVAWYGRLFRGVTRRWRREGASLLSICYRLMEGNEFCDPNFETPASSHRLLKSSLDRRGALAVVLVRLCGHVAGRLRPPSAQSDALSNARRRGDKEC